MRKVKAWVQPNYSPSAIWIGTKKGTIQTVYKWGYCTPEKNAYNIGVTGPSLLKRLNGKRLGKKFKATRTQIIKPLKLSHLKLLSYPTQFIANINTIQDQRVRYHAKIRLHEVIAYPDHMNLNEIPRNSAILFRCPYCGKAITRFKRSNRIAYPNHCGFECYPEKITYANITLYQLGFNEGAENIRTYRVRINAPLPKPHTLKRNYDQVPEYYSNHFEKCLTFNPNRINISTLGYVKPLSEISDYDRVTVITQ